VKFYDFIDKAPRIGPLVVIEGTEAALAERAIATVEERLLDPATRDLNGERFEATALESMSAVENACAALPFLGEARVIVVRGAQAMRAAPRRALWEVAQGVPAGNTLVIEDLQSPLKRTKPQTFGQLAGRDALRIDTTASADARARYVAEALADLRAAAEPAAVAAIANGDAPLAAVRTDLEKLSLGGERITLEDLKRESIAADDVKAYEVASALVEGRTGAALALAAEMFALDGRRAGPMLLDAVAREYRLVWEVARPGGEIPARMRWRERALRPIAARLGAAGARMGFERAVLAFEAIVTGRADDPRTVLTLLAASASVEGRER
jgi:DNA polymerase III delta subunit